MPTGIDSSIKINPKFLILLFIPKAMVITAIEWVLGKEDVGLCGINRCTVLLLTNGLGT
jgi:hypothetical protein